VAGLFLRGRLGHGLQCTGIREELMDDHEVERAARSNDAIPARDRVTG
jgi:hypothetical protein